MVRKHPYTKEEIEKMVDCLVDNNLIDSNADDDVYWLYRGLEKYMRE